MAILLNNFAKPRSNAFAVQRAGNLYPTRAISVPIQQTAEQELASTKPTTHRKPVVMKPIVRDGDKTKSFSNPNHPLIKYDSAPLDSVLESISFKKKPKQKGMGVKLVI